MGYRSMQEPARLKLVIMESFTGYVEVDKSSAAGPVMNLKNRLEETAEASQKQRPAGWHRAGKYVCPEGNPQIPRQNLSSLHGEHGVPELWGANSVKTSIAMCDFLKEKGL